MQEKRRNLFPWILFGGGLLLLVAGLASVLLRQPAQLQRTATPASAAQVQRVSLEDAKAALDAGKAVFLDVRASNSYADAHIPGALSIPLDQLPNRMGELDPQSWIIPY